MFQSTLEPGQTPTNSTPLLEPLAPDQPEVAPRVSPIRLPSSEGEEGSEESGTRRRGDRQVRAGSSSAAALDPIEEESDSSLEEALRTPPRGGDYISLEVEETEVSRPAVEPGARREPPLPLTLASALPSADEVEEREEVEVSQGPSRPQRGRATASRSTLVKRKRSSDLTVALTAGKRAAGKKALASTSGQSEVLRTIELTKPITQMTRSECLDFFESAFLDEDAKHFEGTSRAEHLMSSANSLLKVFVILHSPSLLGLLPSYFESSFDFLL